VHHCVTKQYILVHG